MTGGETSTTAWVNQGVKCLPKNACNKQIILFHRYPNGPSPDFKRHAYELDSPNNFVLLYYLGNEGTAVDFPHGNKRNDARKHVQICPSLLNNITIECTRSTTSKVYKTAVTNLPSLSHIPVLLPKNLKASGKQPNEATSEDQNFT